MAVNGSISERTGSRRRLVLLREAIHVQSLNLWEVRQQEVYEVKLDERSSNNLPKPWLSVREE